MCVHAYSYTCVCVCVCAYLNVSHLTSILLFYHESLKYNYLYRSFQGVGSVSLWEDRMMAGFMPLKADLNVMDTFSIPELSKLSTEVSKQLHFVKIIA